MPLSLITYKGITAVVTFDKGLGLALKSRENVFSAGIGGVHQLRHGVDQRLQFLLPLIAQAFQSVHYPILPGVDHVHDPDSPVKDPQQQKEILRIRHHSLFAPRDFDISPYFSIVKPTVEAGFDYRQVPWARPADEAA